ncbi:MAG: FAD-dependent oxidoreductase [Faecalicatena sp.]|uniref:FAD-dependent oxidoreductase n=1 Tax=Faecalicatena sp. TaxID=2005360 RepID=UPI002585AD6B|nr:FAD-dependent oxidoreductase [Faecalicatena sp.]MCI6465219.1 FAD-dependent oxidoreductase [Faecalicatena sp.]MDY5618584.1 FAD-dependent oxidoreductase [Lachnospiraceae bacterium]
MKYNDVIIGFGKGGKTIAGALGNAGRKVVLIEKSDKMYGGTCINVGCIPTKSLINSAKKAVLGCTDGKSAYQDAVARKTQLVGKLRKKNYQKLDTNPNVSVVNGTASFISPHEVEVVTENGRMVIEGERFFINTGASPFIPPIKGVEGNPYVYVSETLMDVTELPERLVIIGGGYIGVEFASIYANFGTKVTIIQDGAVFLPREDAEIADEVKKSLEKRGVRVLTETKVQEVTEESDHAAVHIETKEGEEVLSAKAVLIATGRRPNTKGLNLEAAGVQVNERGGIITDNTRTTTAPHIFAMGDVVGGLQFTYISLDDYRIVASKVLGDGSYTLDKRGAVPYSVFLNPPFSRVGMSEKEALAAGYKVKIAKLPVAAIPKAQVLEQPEGILKAVIDADTRKILGAHLFCEESHELINLVKLAMDAGLEYTVLKNMIFTHPTMGEALNDLFNL